MNERKNLVVGLVHDCARFAFEQNLVLQSVKFWDKLVIRQIEGHVWNAGLVRGDLPSDIHPEISWCDDLLWFGGYGNNQYFYDEYDDFIDDPEIGSFLSDDPQDPLKAIIAHEIAHCIQFWNHKVSHRGGWPADHGQEWQDIYKVLRVNWVGR